MGVQLRSLQRKFTTFMDDVHPEIRPRFIVWLDERLAEFKINGTMTLSETLEDPQWIKNYYKSKHNAKLAAINRRKSKRLDIKASDIVSPKIEATSEATSSNGHILPDEAEKKLFEDVSEDADKFIDESNKPVDEKISSEEPSFNLVEVKKELIEEEDDMFIVGETFTPSSQISYDDQPAQVAGNRFLRPFRRKRQLLSPSTQYQTFSVSRSNFKNRYRSIPHGTSIIGHTRVSSVSSNMPSKVSTAADYRQFYDENSSNEHYDESTLYTETESLRIPGHLQRDLSNVQMTETEPYSADAGDMYVEYNEEPYDSSYMTDSAIQYDAEGNAIIQGNLNYDVSPGDPVAEPSPSTSQESTYGKYWHKNHRLSRRSNHICSYCYKMFSSRSTLLAHVNYYHLKKSRHICPACGKSFPSTMNLEGHVNSSHLNIRPFVCTFCEASFFYRAHLQSHSKQCRKSKILSQAIH